MLCWDPVVLSQAPFGYLVVLWLWTCCTAEASAAFLGNEANLPSHMECINGEVRLFHFLVNGGRYKTHWKEVPDSGETS